jgi:hypothetical protein
MGAALIAFIAASSTADASPVSRAQVATILGADATNEGFELYTVDGASDVLNDAVGMPIAELDSATETIDGQGPGLVKDGVTFRTQGGEGIQWNRAGFGHTKDIVASFGSPMEIDFTSSTPAFAVDLRSIFTSFSMTAMLEIFDSNGGMSTEYVDLGNAGDVSRFGWHHLGAGGVTRVVISSMTSGYAPTIDNILFLGLTATPNPEVSSAAMATMLAGVGIIGVSAKRLLKRFGFRRAKPAPAAS